MPKTIFTIGVIGHRELGGNDVAVYVQSCCHKILSELKAKYQDLRAISALSKGADSIFAQVALSLNIPLETVVPFYDFKSDFNDESSLERHNLLRQRSKIVTHVNFSTRSSFAYRKSMEWVIFKSNIVIAVWDGRTIGSTGGTWEAISLCEKLNKAITYIDIDKKTMNTIDKSSSSF